MFVKVRNAGNLIDGPLTPDATSDTDAGYSASDEHFGGQQQWDFEGASKCCRMEGNSDSDHPDTMRPIAAISVRWGEGRWPGWPIQ